MKKLLALTAAVGSSVSLMAFNAYAALPTEASTAMTETKSDTAEIALGVFLVLVGIFTFKMLRRAL